MILTISVIKGKDKDKSQLFDTFPISIGRFPDNDYVLSDPSVSRRHSMLYLNENKLTICDVESTNGTYLNKERLSDPLSISNKDRIYIGETVLEIQINGEN